MTAPAFKTLDDLLATYVETGRLAGAVGAVTTAENTCFLKAVGVQDLRSGTPMSYRSIFRIYSMTKPIASIAAMMLWEEGRFALDDAVSKYLPPFRNTAVLNPDGTVRPARREMSIRDLLRHTAGITLPAYADGPLASLYRACDLDGMRSRGTLPEIIDRLGPMPVLFEPGSRWAYSMATDVIGRLIEVWSGEPLQDFLQKRLFAPMGMVDTGFQVPAGEKSRLTSVYAIEDGKIGRLTESAEASLCLSPPEFHSGAGGLVSTTADYLRFLRMLVGEGMLDGTRIIGRETLALMTRNHLQGDMAAMGAGDFNGGDWRGIGFGLGFSVVTDAANARLAGEDGDFCWTGAAGTAFFVSPTRGVAALLLTQYMPSRAYPLHAQFRSAVHEGLKEEPLPAWSGSTQAL